MGKRQQLRRDAVFTYMGAPRAARRGVDVTGQTPPRLGGQKWSQGQQRGIRAQLALAGRVSVDFWGRRAGHSLSPSPPAPI